MAEAENDAAMVTDAENALLALNSRAEQMRLESMLSGEADGNDSYLEIHAGAGGTESQDWASMLLRMYMRWAERHDYKLQLIEESEGEGAGIKSTTLLVKGPNAYGWLKTEAGVHRLVRISPFDSNARRHTSFSSVTVYPVIDQSIEIDIPEKDVRIDVYRASGAGGQHVNKTESAVRITHLPTGIAVASQSERSQHQNRAICWDMLKSRLYEIELEKKKAETGAFVGEKNDIGWGHQIRSYVLQPYQLVKDLRTGVESRTAAGRAGRRPRSLHGGSAGARGRRQTARESRRPGIGLPSNGRAPQGVAAPWRQPREKSKTGVIQLRRRLAEEQTSAGATPALQPAERVGAVWQSACLLSARPSSSGLSLWRQLPSKKAPDSTAKASCRMSPSTWLVAASRTLRARMRPNTLPRTVTSSARISPLISALSPITRPTLRTSPSTRPSTWMSPVEFMVPLITMSALMMEGADSARVRFGWACWTAGMGGGAGAAHLCFC